MRRQDHAMQPVLRRLVSLVPEPQASTAQRIELVDVELSAPVPDLAGIQADTVRILALAHGHPLGIVELPGASETASTEVRAKSDAALGLEKKKEQKRKT